MEYVEETCKQQWANFSTTTPLLMKRKQPQTVDKQIRMTVFLENLVIKIGDSKCSMKKKECKISKLKTIQNCWEKLKT